MATVSGVRTQVAVERKGTGLNGLIAVSHVVVVPDIVPSASLGTMVLLAVTVTLDSVTKTIVLPGLHGNRGVVVLLNVKKRMVWTQ